MQEMFADYARSFAESHNAKAFADSEEGFSKHDAKEFMDKKEGFSSIRGYPLMNESTMSMVGRVVAMLLAVLLIAMFGRYLWNSHVTKILSFAKPTGSVMDVIALYVFVRLILG